MPSAAARALRALSAHGLLDALARNLSAEEERWFPWWVVGFGAGIAAYFGAQDEPSTAFAAVVAVAAMAAAFGASKSQGVLLRFLCAVIAAGGFGFAAAKLGTALVEGPVIQRDIESIAVSGRIESVDIARPNRARIVLTPARVGNNGQTPPSRLRLTVSGATAVAGLHPGDWVSARAELRPPPEPAMPHGYDFARWAFFQGIGGVGFTYGAPKPIEAPRPDTWLERFGATVEGWRMAMTERIRKALPGPDGSIAAALITGERGAIPAEDTTAYRDSGLSHVLSISGLHLALAGLGIFWLVRAVLALFPAVALTQPIKKWAAVGAFASASFYLLISGGGAPALRSYLMLSAMLLSVVADRPALSMRGVAMAALVILAFQPQDIVDPGFQMSFAAVIGLIALAEWAASRPRTHAGATGTMFGVPARLRRYLVGILTASFVATLMTTPFAIYHFDRAASYSLLANLLAEPVVAFIIMPAAALAVTLMPLGWEYGPLQLMGWGVHQMTAIAHFVAELPGATTLVRALPDAALFAVVLGGMWLVLWRRRWRWFGLGPILAGLVAIWFSAAPDLFVARDGRSVAVRQEDGTLAILAPKPDDYTAAQWLLRDGDNRSIETARANAHCDSEGCVAQGFGGRVVALALKPSALIDDCAKAAVIVSTVSVRRDCDGPMLVINRFALLKSGAMSVTFRSGRAEIETVAEERGHRPWTKPVNGASTYRERRPLPPGNSAASPARAGEEK